MCDTSHLKTTHIALSLECLDTSRESEDVKECVYECEYVVT